MYTYGISISQSTLMDTSRILLSTDTLSGYGLDHIFEVAEDAGFGGIDLAIWKNFDTRNSAYVKKLKAKHNIAVPIIQVSSDINSKEMAQALDLATILDTKIIVINPPSTFNLTSYHFITSKLPQIQTENPSIQFAIINPPEDMVFILPIPKFKFSNVEQITSKYNCKIWLDITHVDGDFVDSDMMKKLPQHLKNTSTIYISDKTKKWVRHLPLWEWDMKLDLLFKKMSKLSYDWYFSIKYALSKKQLADMDEVEVVLKKAISAISTSL
jgi:sugar phosphate isomerase/epimerase